MNITVNDDRVIELTLEHWAKAAGDERIVHGTYTPGGLVDWWTESWCIGDDAPVSLIPHLASPTADIPTGDEYVQLNVRQSKQNLRRKRKKTTEMRLCKNPRPSRRISSNMQTTLLMTW